MVRRAALLLLLGSLLALAPAQGRYVEVVLAGGETLSGRVVEMELDHLSVEVDGEVVRLESAALRSCRFSSAEERALTTASAGAQQAPAGVPGAQPAAVAAPEQGPTAPAVEPEIAPPAPAAEVALPWDRPLPDPVGLTDPESVPVDLRHRFLLQPRLEAFDRAYPWLAPAAPPQWVSLGLLLLVGSGLLVHLSVNIAGADRPQLGRSVGLGLWYLATALGQVALVPVNDLSVTVMVLLNGALSLFLLRQLFGLQRAQAFVAQVMQLGLAALTFAGLELVNSLLGSIGVAS